MKVHVKNQNWKGKMQSESNLGIEEPKAIDNTTVENLLLTLFHKGSYVGDKYVLLQM